MCLCVAGAAGGALPRVFMDVALPGRADGEKRRYKALIDTGFTQKLVSSAVVQDLGDLSLLKEEDGIVALHGEQLPVQGTLELLYSRSDGAVIITPVIANTFVLPNLAVVGADVEA